MANYVELVRMRADAYPGLQANAERLASCELERALLDVCLKYDRLSAETVEIYLDEEAIPAGGVLLDGMRVLVENISKYKELKFLGYRNNLGKNPQFISCLQATANILNELQPCIIYGWMSLTDPIVELLWAQAEDTRHELYRQRLQRCERELGLVIKMMYLMLTGFK